MRETKRIRRSNSLGHSSGLQKGLRHMVYKGITFSHPLQIDQIFSLHYFEYMSTFFFPGESHSFWEFICVDKGEVEIGAGEKSFILKKNDIYFHKPDEFHWVKANGKVAPNLIVMSFSCTGDLIQFFEDKLLQVNRAERQILANIFKEAEICIEDRLDDPYQTTLCLKDGCSPVSPQLIHIYLESFLLNLYRRFSESDPVSCNGTWHPIDRTTRENTSRELFDRIDSYLNTNIGNQLTIEKICRDNLVGRSQLQKLFQEYGGCGIIEYFSNMKIEMAKQMIRSEQMNFTEISEKLGYSSIHYFSRQFKKITRMSPSEYASSIKAMADQRG